MKTNKKIKYTKFIGVKVNQEIYDWLLAGAENNGRSLAQQVRFLVTELKRGKKASKSTRLVGG